MLFPADTKHNMYVVLVGHPNKHAKLILPGTYLYLSLMMTDHNQVPHGSCVEKPLILNDSQFNVFVGWKYIFCKD